MSTGKTNETTSNQQNRTFDFGEWTITVKKSHILSSKCSNPDGCTEESKCQFCHYEKTLVIPQFPDMVFPENVLRVERTKDRVGLEFNSLDALSSVAFNPDGVKVGPSDAWREARADSEYINQVSKIYDWTFTTSYQGTFIGKETQLSVVPTTQKIDVEKLKQREAILFYDDVDIFEDELADHGCSSLSVKIRVMPSGFFILLRFYLRIDNVLIRIHDTRIHYEIESDYMLREYSTRESKISELGNLPYSTICDPNEVRAHLKLKEEHNEKLQIPKFE